MKKIALLCLCLCLLFPARAALAEKKSAFPELLKFTQKTEKEYVGTDIYVSRTYPKTANPQVNAEMAAVIDDMAQRGTPFLPARAGEIPSYLDVGAYIYRTGEKYMSFLTIGRIAHEKEQTYVDFDARVYDMETGTRLTLRDVFPEDSPAWDTLARAVREQLDAYYPALHADESALDALCQRDALADAPFTLGVARLSLHYRADALYPGKNTLMHVNLFYRDVRPDMTENAKIQTDNSAYKLIALTFDDGGARGYSLNAMNELRNYGANATFFAVGTMFRSNHDVLCRQQDSGYSLQSHNYEHVYENLTPEKITDWKIRFKNQMSDVTGWQPTLMRAPGGIFNPYIQAGAGYPLIQWSVISGDAGSSNVNAIANTVLNNARDGAVVLMHDLNPRCRDYLQLILPVLEEKGYQCVTVEEMFSHYGVELLPDHVYYSCEEEAAAR